MIQKFNFYDVYGYLLPGLTFLALTWLPFGLIERHWPPKELASALAAIAFAYVIGHLLQTFAVNSLPSKDNDSQGRPRWPSDIILDAADNTFSPEFKMLVAARVRAAFRIDLGERPGESLSDLSRRRQDAFFLCRSALIKGKAALYAEQFQGMYSLMRGLTLAFGLGTFYIAGWLLTWFTCASPRIGLITAGFAALVAVSIEGVVLLLDVQEPAKRQKAARLTVAALGAALCALGYLSGLNSIAPPGSAAPNWTVLVVIAGSGLLASMKCFGAYKTFAKEFAKAVYRDFCTYETPQDRAERG